jgi:hypothetical protein
MTCRPSFPAVIFLFFAFFFSASSATAGTVNYSYDDNNRLIKADFSNNSISWQYDKNNNMLDRTAAHQFPWLLFIPVFIRQQEQQPQSQSMTASDSKQSPVAK